MSELFKSLEWADGQINPSGIKTIVYYAPKSWIKTFPRIANPVASVKENVVVAGDFEMQPGKTFLRLYSTQGMGHVEWEPLGEKDHKMFMNKGSFSFPDISDEARSIAKQTINANIVMIVPLPHESEKRFVMLGDADYDVTVTIKGTSGDKPGSAKGINFEVEVPATTPLPGYAGELLLPDGSLDCETGVFQSSNDYINIGASSGTVIAAGGTVNIIVDSNVDWTASSDQAFCTLLPLTGSGPGTVVATFAANSGAARPAVITFSATGVDPESVTITQDAA